MLPTIDMSEPMQEVIPAVVVGSDFAQAWSCCTTLPMTSVALIDAFLSFSGTPLFVLVNMSTSCFRQYEGAMRASDRFFDAAPTYHLLSAAALNSSRNWNLHESAAASAPCSRASPIPLVRASSPAWRDPAVAGAGEGACRPGARCDPQPGDAGSNDDTRNGGKPLHFLLKIALVMAPLAAGVVASPGPS
jgi:hypothetical protein